MLKRTIFSEKELKIVRLRIRGHSNAEIARLLNVSRADVTQTFQRLAGKIRKFEDSISVMASLGMIQHGPSMALTNLGAELKHARNYASRQRVQVSTPVVAESREITGIVIAKEIGKTISESSKQHIVDLTKLETEGSFPCPGCGTVISPDDETEAHYQIVERLIENDELTELVLRCSTCGTLVRLVGFLSHQNSRSKASRNKKSNAARSRHTLEVDLRELEGQESFLCPTCQTEITPRNVTARVYKMLLEEAQEDRVSNLYTICSGCGSRIKLLGFADYILKRILRSHCVT